MPGIRKVTREQFSDGTTVDGNRIELAMQDVVDRINNIPKGDLRRSFTQNQIISGLIPVTTSAWTGNEQTPFMDLLNERTSATWLGSIPPEVLNSHRVKGVQDDDMTAFKVWEASTYFRDPIVIVQLDVFLLTDSAHTNTFVWGSSAPGNRTNNGVVDDFHVTITVDDPWIPERRRRNAVEYARHLVKATAENISSVAMSVPSSDMAPAAAAGAAIAGVHVHARDLNLPIHRDARVRWNLTIPTGHDPWGSTPVGMQYYTTVLTYLEEVKSG